MGGRLSYFLTQPALVMVKPSAAPSPWARLLLGRGLGLSQHTWHCMSDCRKSPLQLSITPWTVSQDRLSWWSLFWSSVDSGLSLGRDSLWLTLTETIKVL